MFHCQFLFILFTILAKFCSMLLYHVREKCVAMYVRLMLEIHVNFKFRSLVVRKC
jgi:hypothetical protein